MFMVQAAVVKGQGGIATAVAHYEHMFREVGACSAVLFSGPSRDALRAQGFDLLDAPPMLTSPVAGAMPLMGDLKKAIQDRAGAQELVFIVHSDLTLPALRRLFPRARFVTPCHSDKFKHKARANLVITLNATQHALAKAALPGVRVAQLGNPYVAPAPAPLQEGGDVRFNFVGRFTPTKDPETFLRAAASLNDAAPRLEFRFIGSGELEQTLRRLAGELEVNATFPGWLSKPFSHFHNKDVLVLPSQWEGLPYLLQEALDHGVPIIAAANAGNRAALGEGAYGALFPVGDAAALAEAQRRAFSDLDPLRLAAEKGRAALRETYGANAFWTGLQRELKSA
jgi:glycosyltransferase involved in cell wall biosynthesis